MPRRVGSPRAPAKRPRSRSNSSVLISEMIGGRRWLVSSPIPPWSPMAEPTVRDAISAVPEPRLRRTLGELGVIRHLEEAGKGRWRLGLAVPEAGWALGPITAAVTSAARQGGGEKMRVEAGPMDAADAESL